MAEELYTFVNIGEDEYRIKKFRPSTGAYVALFVASKLTPIIPVLRGGVNQKDDGDQNLFDMIAALGNSLGSISEEEIDALFTKCLRVCQKRMPGGNLVPCIGENGNFRVEDLEHDMITTLCLVIHAIQWGAADFFGEKRSLLTGMFAQITSLPDTKT